MSLHTAMAAVVFSVPMFVPTRLMNVRDNAPDFDTQVEYQPLFLPTLPRLAETSASAKPKIGSGQEPRSVPDALGAVVAAEPPILSRPKRDYAGAQTIVSNFPDSTKGVQTIRRPDLVSPPKLSYPLRLPSLVALPTPSIPAPAALRLQKSVLSKPKVPPTVRAVEPPVPAPALTVEIPKLSVPPAEPVPPKMTPPSEPSLPAAATAVPAGSAPKAVVVINAVSVPPPPALVIPDAELTSRFVVGPSREATVVATASETASGKLAAAGASNAGEKLPHPSQENGTGTRVVLAPEAKGSAPAEVGGSYAGAASTGTLSNMGAQPGSGNATVTPPGNKGLAGISISGGVPGRSGRVVAASPIARGSYALTIISGGTSGGASRDLGVFSRSDTVYTVYIPMTDAGGGPDWPMQYALMNPAQAHNGLPNGLLIPPVVLKKSQATAPKTEFTVNSGPVFVTGIIDENGKLQALRAMRALDGRTQSAVNALAQWEFLAAQLDGKPVASKVLIGVSVMPVEKVEK